MKPISSYMHGDFECKVRGTYRQAQPIFMWHNIEQLHNVRMLHARGMADLHCKDLPSKSKP